MASQYTTVLDTGSGTLPALPLVLMLAAPVLLLACFHVAKLRKWRVSKPISLARFVKEVSDLLPEAVN